MMSRHPNKTREFPYSAEDFTYLAGILKTYTGISLSEKKIDLVYARLVKRIRFLGLASFRQYIDFLVAPNNGQELSHLVNAMTTNLTRFFREPQHFDHMRKIALPECLAFMEKQKSQRLRIWSAGCASGEEAYSIALTLHQMMPDLALLDARILATDLDTNVLQNAHAGRYSAEVITALPPNERHNLASPLGRPKTDNWQIKSELRSLIAFKRLNLIDKWPMTGSFDIIFCRNVMIYFDRDTTNQILTQFARLLRPGGWLYIGHSENILGLTNQFERVGSTTYQRLT